MPKPPPKNTALGLGRATTSTAPPASVEVRRRDSRSVDRPRPARRTTLAWEAQPEAVTAMHPRPREGRAAIKIDDVGEAAAKLARTRRESAPKLIASRAVIAKAPIDTRTAFVLSLVDGRNTVDAIIDMAGMPEDEVRTILARLARLGLINGL